MLFTGNFFHSIVKIVYACINGIDFFSLSLPLLSICVLLRFDALDPWHHIMETSILCGEFNKLFVCLQSQ
jgi:hypothetical protein